MQCRMSDGATGKTARYYLQFAACLTQRVREMT
jgi:hypothetical protein